MRARCAGARELFTITSKGGAPLLRLKHRGNLKRNEGESKMWGFLLGSALALEPGSFVNYLCLIRRRRAWQGKKQAYDGY